MNKYLKYGLIASAIIVAILLISKNVKKDDDSTESDANKDFDDLITKIEEAKK